MAKSIRSKWKRKMRAIKRVRYDQKSTDKLKLLLSVQQHKEEQEDLKKDAAMTEPEPTSSGVADVVKTKINARTLRDPKNQYPGWLTKKQKKIMTSKVKNSKKLKNKKKVLPSVWKQSL